MWGGIVFGTGVFPIGLIKSFGSTRSQKALVTVADMVVQSVKDKFRFFSVKEGRRDQRKGKSQKEGRRDQARERSSSFAFP